MAAPSPARVRRAPAGTVRRPRSLPKAQSARYVTQVLRSQRANALYAVPRLIRVLRGQGDNFITRYLASGDIPGEVDKKRMENVVSALWVRQGVISKKLTADVLGVENVARPELIRALRREGLNNVVGIDQTTVKLLRRTTVTGQRLGLSTREVAYGTTARARELQRTTRWRPISRYVDETSKGRALAIARSEASMANNSASLIESESLGVSTVEIVDGKDCGWRYHDDPDKANGSIRTIEEAQRHLTSHTNCRRAIIPTYPEVSVLAERQIQRTGVAPRVRSVRPVPSRLPSLFRRERFTEVERDSLDQLRAVYEAGRVGDGRAHPDDLVELGSYVRSLIVPKVTQRLARRQARVDKADLALRQAQIEWRRSIARWRNRYGRRRVVTGRVTGRRRGRPRGPFGIFGRGRARPDPIDFYHDAAGDRIEEFVLVNGRRYANPTIPLRQNLIRESARYDERYRVELARALGEVRPFGTESRVRIRSPLFNLSLRKDARAATDLYPSDWLTGLDDVVIRSDRSAHSLAHYTPTDKVITVSRDYHVNYGSRQSITHEIGHYVEYAFPHLHRNQKALRELQRERFYDWADPYYNKKYNMGYGEIISMGMEALFWPRATALIRRGVDSRVESFMLGLLVAG